MNNTTKTKEIVARIRQGDIVDLYGVDLRGANLSRANLCGMDLSGVNLSGACLHGTDLSHANLHGADLRGTDLRYTILRHASLRGANLRSAMLPRFQIPQEGDLTVYKQLDQGTRIITLRIPGTAKRTATLVSRKCRAEFAWVVSGSGQSERGGIYTESEIVRPDKYDDDVRIACTHGIHFFLTREEAEEY